MALQTNPLDGPTTSPTVGDFGLTAVTDDTNHADMKRGQKIPESPSLTPPTDVWGFALSPLQL